MQLKSLIEKAVPICADENEIYEIVFDSYIFHITRNESYTGPDDEEICKGKYFVIFEKSKLLKFMPQLVECGLIDAMYPEGYVHYAKLAIPLKIIHPTSLDTMAGSDRKLCAWGIVRGGAGHLCSNHSFNAEPCAS